MFSVLHSPLSALHSPLSTLHSPLSTLSLPEAEEVVAEGGGEGCEGAVGRGIARGDDAEDEADGRESVEGKGYGREDFVAHHTAVGTRGQLEARLRGVGNEGGAEAEEDDVDHDEEQAGGHDVLLRVAEGLAGEVLLHHVLVEARHGDGDEHAGEHLLEPELGGHGVGVEHLGVALLGGGAQEVRQAHVEVAEDGHHGGHGSEDEEYISRLRSLTDKPLIKAIKVQSKADIEAADESSADYVLLDSGAGTGMTFNWQLIKGIKRPYFLAGGLNPENVAEAVKALNPYAVDVSSGIETDGLKDEAKMADFVSIVRKESDND